MAFIKSWIVPVKGFKQIRTRAPELFLLCLPFLFLTIIDVALSGLPIIVLWAMCLIWQEE